MGGWVKTNNKRREGGDLVRTNEGEGCDMGAHYCRDAAADWLIIDWSLGSANQGVVRYR